MNTIFLAQNAAAGGSNLIMIVIMIALFAFMYFFVMRPQKKQQQARMKMMSELKKGDRVVMMGGLHGKIDSINKEDNTVVIDADGIFLTFSRMAVRTVLPANPVTKQEVASNEAHEEKPAEKTEVTQKDEKPETKSETPDASDKKED